MSDVAAINRTLKVLADRLGEIEAQRNEVLSAKYALERVRAKMVADATALSEEPTDG